MSLIDDINERKRKVAMKINKRTRDKLKKDKTYRATIKAYIQDIDSEEKVKYCMDNDLDIFTMLPNKRCDECGGVNSCYCYINHPG